MADSVTRDYWSRYFGDYGKIWVKDIPIKIKAALVASDSNLAKQAQFWRKKPQGPAKPVKPKFFLVHSAYDPEQCYWFRDPASRAGAIPFLYKDRASTALVLLTVEPNEDLDFETAVSQLGPRQELPGGQRAILVPISMIRGTSVLEARGDKGSSYWNIVEQKNLTYDNVDFDQKIWLRTDKSPQTQKPTVKSTQPRSEPEPLPMEPSDRYAAIAMEPLGYRKAENDGLVVEAMARVGEKLIPVTATFDAQGTLIAFVRGAA